MKAQHHHPLLLACTILTITWPITTTTALSFYQKEDCVTHEELDEKLWEFKSFLQKLADFVNFEYDSSGGYLSFNIKPPTPYFKRPLPPPPRKKYFIAQSSVVQPYQGYLQGSGNGRLSYPAPRGYFPNGYGITYDYSHGRFDCNGLYYLAFLGKAGTGKPIYDLYTGPGDNDTYITRRKCGCVSLSQGYQRKACEDDHYKSHIVTLWADGKLAIDKVRVSVYKGGEEQTYFIFDGEGSTPLDFFSKDRLIFSPYNDLSKDKATNYFSVEGHLKRRFFINQAYGGHCTKDIGWQVVVDAADPRDKCDWTNRRFYPLFLYAHAGTSQIWHSGEIGKGDIFVISLKLKSYGVPLKYTDIRNCLF